MPSCAICGRSRNKKTKDDHITFHRLPQSTVIQAQWLKFARENGNHESLLKVFISLFCYAHFAASCLERFTYTTHLKSNAVPTIKIKRIKCAKILYSEIKIPIPVDEHIQSSSSTPTCSNSTDQPISEEIKGPSEYTFFKFLKDLPKK